MEHEDAIWQAIRREVEETSERESMLASFLHATVLNHSRLEDALSFHLASKLASPAVHSMSIREVFDEAFASDPSIGEAVRADIRAVKDRDPACPGYSVPLLNFKGFHALESYRVAHWLWRQGRRALALHLQSVIAEVFSVDIHPAARLGKGILLDHADGLVIGETAVVDDDVSILHGVTLGGTGKETGDRHPKIRRGVLLAARATVLGNVVVGEGAKVAAGSVVLQDVPPHSTVAGVPARVVGHPHEQQPALVMDQRLTPEEEARTLSPTQGAGE
jgi:serine O-acetyltransferase